MKENLSEDLVAKQSKQMDSTSEEDQRISKDKIFHILQNQRRRYVLQYLENQTEGCILRDLAKQIAAWENEIPVQQVKSDERQRVYIALYQSHLPKMDDVGIINYNQARGTIERTELLGVVNQYRSARFFTEDYNESENKRNKRKIASLDLLSIGLFTSSTGMIGFGIGRWGLKSYKTWLLITLLLPCSAILRTEIETKIL